MKKRISKLFDSESKLLAKNSSWLLLSTVYKVGISFGRSVVIARSLGVEMYGLYAIVLSFVAIVGEAFNLHVGPAMIKYCADYKEDGRPDKVLALYKVAYLFSMITALVSVIAIWGVLALFYDVFFDVENLQKVVGVFAIGYSLSLLNGVPNFMLMIHNRYKVSSTLTLINSTIEFAAICVSLLLLDANLTGLIYTLTAVQFISFVVFNVGAFYFVRSEVWGFWNQPLHCLKQDARTIASFVVNNSLSKTVQKMLKKGDILILAAFTGSSQVGLYDVAKKLSFALLVIKDPLILAVYPQVASLVSAKKMKELKVFLRNIGLLAAVPYTIGATMLYFIGDWIVSRFFGNEFSGAGSILFILVLSVGLDIVFFWIAPYVLSLGKAGYRLRASIFSAIVTLGTGVLLVNIWGAMGVAVSMLVGVLVLQLMLGRVIFNHLRQN